MEELEDKIEEILPKKEQKAEEIQKKKGLDNQRINSGSLITLLEVQKKQREKLAKNKS